MADTNTEIVTMVFNNPDSHTPVHTLKVDRNSTHDIARWYGAYHGGDEYTLTIDGEEIPLDINGEM
jgi:hypothetical protein